ncbi:molybdate ABC transporter substrate-binding protein [Dehalococcoidia bacterium]|nr:molybdate ABC transporter substrate-binding protein [Dehalococcoidia bacterium]
MNKLFVSVLLCFFLLNCSNGNKDSQPLVFAAASLHDALTEIKNQYRLERGKSVKFSFGGSTNLSRQISSYGAPADGVIFSGSQPLVVLINAGKISGNDVTEILQNRLVVIWGKQSENLGSFQDLAFTGGKIAVADKNLAPAGDYSYEALHNSGVYDLVKNRLIPLGDVRSALNTVLSGNSNYGIVYSSDLNIIGSEYDFILIPQEFHSPISYPAVEIKNSKLKYEVRLFFDYLNSKTAGDIFERHGFMTFTLATSK